MKIQIYYEDTDCGGVVYYANYLKYFERARTQYFQENGISVKGLKDQGVQFVVVRTEVDYRSPAVYGDIIDVEVALEEISLASFNLSYLIREAGSKKVIVEGKTRMACIDRNLKPIRLPKDVAGVLNKLPKRR